ncbi:MAG: tetratricopeptide repeat protein, partial [Kiritimatiellia bacterium]|nr:tetratricopeptide repeat protein [Kiritimatiellia bacterium]
MRFFSARLSGSHPAPRFFFVRVAGGIGLLLAAGCAQLSKPTPRNDRVESRAEPMALFARGLSLELSGQPDEALALYAAAHALDPERALILDRLTELLISLRRPKEAADLLESSLKTLPDSADLWWRLGRLYSAEQRWAPAVNALQRAVELRPDDSQMALGLAEALAQADREADAVRALRKAHALGIPTFPVLQAAGRLYLRAQAGGRETRAIAEWIRELTPAGAEIPLLLLAAEIHHRANEPEPAKRLLLQILNRHSADPNHRLQLAQALLNIGERPLALPLLEELSNIEDPASQNVLDFLAAVHMENADQTADPQIERPAREAAVSALERLIRMNPGLLRPRLALADQYLRLERIPEAVAAMEAVDSDDPYLQRALALRLVSGPQAEAVGLWLEQAAEADPTRIWIQQALGEIELASKQADRAIARFELAAKTPIPLLRTFGSWSAALLLRDRHPAAADALLARGLEVHPDHPLLHELRSNLSLAARDPGNAADHLEQARKAWIVRQGHPPPLLLAQLAVAQIFADQPEAAFISLDAALEADLYLIQNVAEIGALWATRLERKEPPRLLMERGRTRHPESPLIPIIAGLYENTIEEYERAIPHFQS